MHGDIALEFGTAAELVRRYAAELPHRAALVDPLRTLTYGELHTLMDRVAVALQRDGIKSGDAIAICAGSSVEYAAVFLGALRAGAVVAPLAPGMLPASLDGMVANAGAKLLFVDATTAMSFDAAKPDAPARVALDDSGICNSLSSWLAPRGQVPTEVRIGPDSPFNIIYSSGTTGEPKGIVHSHGMRWAHMRRGFAFGYGPGTVTLLSTPLYSNTTLVVFFPSLAFGATVVLLPRFDASAYLQLAQRLRVTHTILVPVQYQRLMALADFDRYDLSSFRFKLCTSAPFAAELKADVLKRWPGGLVEYYGMTEGGGTCILEAHLFPDKVHTVGRPAAMTDIRLIDDAGCQLGPGATGEIVGHSPAMMVGYHRQPDKTREAEWFDATGKRFIRTGDIGRFDEDGFLILVDRKKDLIISGGFNVYPSDLEVVARAHPAITDVCVVGVPSKAWGETPVAFVVMAPGATENAQTLLAWINTRVGKTQRVSAVHLLDELPRSAIGKVLKRELRDRLSSTAQLNTA